MKHSVLIVIVILATLTYVSPCKFQVEYSWSVVNFTWKSYDSYMTAIRQQTYIPQNVVPGGIKFYGDRLYITVPKFRKGVPVTLTYIPKDNVGLDNLLVPFPSWKANDDRICENLQSVLGMEIDTNGVMWVLDGVRINNNHIECPPKILLLDLNSNGKLIQQYQVPQEISLQNGGYMNDLVIDETDGGYAYIADNSPMDPGLIVYSRLENRAWKLRDSTMFAEQRAANFRVRNDILSQLMAIDGIALSPPLTYEKILLYTSVTAFGVYGLNTTLLKNETTITTEDWRGQVVRFGDKQAQTDGMMMDSRGDLYYGLIPLYGVGRWNLLKPIDTSEIIYTNPETMVWTDGFGMDQAGNLYLMANQGYRFQNVSFELSSTPEVKFRIHKCYTGSRSYLYND